MTEVFKTEKGKGLKGWESLTELNRDEATPTWEDLTEEKFGGDKEKIEPIVLSDKDVQRLSSSEQTLYVTNPVLYTQVKRLEDSRGKTDSTDFLMSGLSRQIEMLSYEDYNQAKEFQRSSKSLEQLAGIFDRLGDRALSLDLQIFERDETEINNMAHCLDIASSEMPLEEVDEGIETKPQTRTGLVRSILGKLRRRRGKENGFENNSGAKSRNHYRKVFFEGLINDYRPENLDDKSLRDLSNSVEEIIESKDASYSILFGEELGINKCENIARYARMFNEFKDNSTARAALREYYRFSKMKDGDEEKFRNEILPLVNDERAGGARADVLKMVRLDDNRERLAGKVDFVIKHVMPGYVPNSMKSWAARDKMNEDILRRNTSGEVFEMVYPEVEENVLPFLIKYDAHDKSEYMRRESVALADKVINRVFKEAENAAQVDGEKLKRQMRSCDELMPLIEGATKDNFDLRSKMLELALQRDFEPEFVEYLKTDIAPKIERNDATLGSWTRGWGYMRGEDKYRDYDFDCLTTKISPQNLNELLMERRGLPTSDTNRMEQNRIDALAIERVVVPNHVFIHDEHPLAHDLLSAMVNYYDARESEDFDQARQTLEEVAKQCPLGHYGKLEDYIYDIKNYEKKIKGVVVDDNVDTSREYNNPAIDVLRKLVENTKPSETEIPEVNDEVWRKLMEEAGVRVNPEDGRMRVDWESTGKLAKYVNEWIIERQGKYGLDAMKVDAIAFAERAATYALRNVSGKEWAELPYDEDFKEIVKLQELTGSYGKFNPEEFERFWGWFQSVKMNEEDLRQHYWELAVQEMKNIGKLQRKYEAEGMKDAGEILQSGNLLHEIVMLADGPKSDTLRGRADRMVA